MSLYGRIFAGCYDRMMAGTEKRSLRAHRETLLARTSGRVLEIGAGTGANLAFYGDGVESLSVTEPEEPMARRLERRLGEHGRPAEVVRAPAEKLPFEDNSFDFAVSTLVLCTVADQAKALGELRRVLKPGGELLFIEHVRSDQPRLARWQDRLNGVQRVVGRGCNCNRATVDAIGKAGFTVTELKRETMTKEPPIVRPLVIGGGEPRSRLVTLCYLEVRPAVR